MKRCLPAFLALLSLLSLFTGCGLEEYAYIYPIPRNNIIHGVANATMIIPTTNAGTVFTHFVILYRIYISDTAIPMTPEPGDFPSINPALKTHYDSIDYYNDESGRAFSSSLLESVFRNRGYRYLRLENADIDGVLSESILGSTVEFDFSLSNRIPTMRVDSGSPYTLLRSDELTLPEPDEYLFFNTDKLLIPPETLFDTERNNKPNKGSDEYTYAAMFIIAVGIDTDTYSWVYSNPTLIHVFRLPDDIL